MPQEPHTEKPKPPRAPRPDRFARLLEEMRANPRGDWNIGQIESLCKHYDLTFERPTRGSHYKVSSPHLRGVLTVPHNRPIKPVYIRKFVSLVDAHERRQFEERVKRDG